ARLEVGSVVINGIVEGDVVAKSSVEIKAPGKLKGNVTTPSLSVEKGVIFDGTCTMSKAVSSNGARPNEKKAEAAAAPSKS
ncbi:MAG: polymer-forming cytoskeletal protein, partial [Myxococcota bacterium]